MSFRKYLAALALSGLVCTTKPVTASTLYAVGPWSPDEPANLYTVDPSTAVVTLIGSTGLHNLTGIAFSADGTLYGATTGALYTIDPVTAAISRIGLFGFNAPEGDLAFQPGTGVLFDTSSASDDQLITIDTATGAATIRGPLGTGGRDTSGLAFRSDGALLGVALRSGAADELTQIDPDTAATTDIGPTGTNVPQPTVAGLAFELGTDALFYGAGDDLYRINPTTGAATFIGTTGIGTISGITFYVPEPSAAGLIALLLLFSRVRI